MKKYFKAFIAFIVAVAAAFGTLTFSACESEAEKVAE